MDSKDFNEVLANIQLLRNEVDEKLAERLKLDLLERIYKRLYSFDCNECNKVINELDDQVRELRNKKGLLDKEELKQHIKKIEAMKLHLQKEHKLVPEGYYTSIYISIGVSLGLIFGLTLFHNVALGLPIGMAVGVGVGSGLDADAKKKGKVI
ncbi:hypothetical protein [Clostridium algidicarnis]|uniref:hypothetical protein n=1 Tax=Clostridium algidicarnis TaxID=37659 RepID=UPI001C0BA418|nr:hypothetical protein [Clostridium algidicarnis]MBU3227096.1 hypothetical protein [Clostridium algidicarnis]MBU3250621.1 hypothetical protein [Clostridium algidicarnis]